MRMGAMMEARDINFTFITWTQVMPAGARSCSIENSSCGLSVKQGSVMPIPPPIIH